MEMLIQFGYVVLFSGAFPLAGLLCFANNILELRTDAFKICFSLQRPFAHKAKSIGVWQVRLFKNLDTDLYMYGGGGAAGVLAGRCYLPLIQPLGYCPSVLPDSVLL